MISFQDLRVVNLCNSSLLYRALEELIHRGTDSCQDETKTHTDLNVPEVQLVLDMALDSRQTH